MFQYYQEGGRNPFDEKLQVQLYCMFDITSNKILNKIRRLRDKCLNGGIALKNDCHITLSDVHVCTDNTVLGHDNGTRLKDYLESQEFQLNEIYPIFYDTFIRNRVNFTDTNQIMGVGDPLRMMALKYDTNGKSQFTSFRTQIVTKILDKITELSGFRFSRYHNNTFHYYYTIVGSERRDVLAINKNVYDEDRILPHITIVNNMDFENNRELVPELKRENDSYGFSSVINTIKRTILDDENNETIDVNILEGNLKVSTKPYDWRVFNTELIHGRYTHVLLETTYGFEHRSHAHYYRSISHRAILDNVINHARRELSEKRKRITYDDWDGFKNAPSRGYSYNIRDRILTKVKMEHIDIGTKGIIIKRDRINGLNLYQVKFGSILHVYLEKYIQLTDF